MNNPPSEPQDTDSPPYAVCRCSNGYAQTFTSSLFDGMIQEVDLQCTIRAIALCKRTDGFQHETVVPIISLPNKSEQALVFLERAGYLHDRSFQTPLHASSESSNTSFGKQPNPRQPQKRHPVKEANDVITLLPETSLYWKHHIDSKSPDLPFEKLPSAIKQSSLSSPFWTTLVAAEGEKDQGRLLKRWRSREPDANDPPENSRADHAFIYAITFPEAERSGGTAPPTVLDLAIAFRLVSRHRPNYDLAQHNCYFFAAAICKVLQEKFRGTKVPSPNLRALPSPPCDNSPSSSDNSAPEVEAGACHHEWLRKGKLRPLQILRDDDPYFIEMVDTLVTKFDEERGAHSVIKSREMEGKLRAELKEKDAKMQEMERQLQLYEARFSASAGPSSH
ncbi:hypothetical protein V5O48_009004 [Marasmius crinis-equi]|uniref:PPPDE domain-containing protein n=1 Tax=Marasmius crinis-equi TaxID=585013 RepID=A0ABR3FCH4_9AGAR